MGAVAAVTREIFAETGMAGLGAAAGCRLSMLTRAESLGIYVCDYYNN